MRNALRLFLCSFLSFALGGSAVAQIPGGSGGALVVADGFVFVLDKGILYKLSEENLRLLGSVDLENAVPQPLEEEEEEEVVGRPVSRLALAEADALLWLVRHQDEDGRWDADRFMKHDGKGRPCDGGGSPTHDIGVTGLATLALLGSGSTMRAGPYKSSVRRAAKWLVGQQQKSGLLGPGSTHDYIYDHAIATLALSEAHGLSGERSLVRSVQRAVGYLDSHRNPYGVWRYQPRDGDNDTSVTAWAWMACASARSFGLEVDPKTNDLVDAWFKAVTDDDGRVGYTGRGESSSRNSGDHARRFPAEESEALTAAGLLGRFLLGQDPVEVPLMRKSAERLLAHPPAWDVEAGTIDPYYWYFGTMAMRQMGGRYWKEWSRTLDDLVDAQRRRGNAKGSWDPVGVWDMDGGRVYATALYALALQAANRLT